MEKIEVQTPAEIARDMLAGVPTENPPAATPGTALTAGESSSAETGVDRGAGPSAETGVAGSLRDDGGHAFRPDFHRVGVDGKPFKNKRGLFMPRGGRKPGVKNSTPSPTPSAEGAWTHAEKTAAVAPVPVVADTKKTETPPQSAASAQPQPDQADSPDDAAEVVCLSLYTFVGFIFDAPEDCQPTPTQHEHYRRQTASYLRLKGFKSSAGWAVVLMGVVYVLRVIGKPKPAAKLREYVRTVWENWKAGREKPAEKVAPEKTAHMPSTPANATIVLRPNLNALSERSA